MSLSDALKHINEAGLLLQRASKTLSGHGPTPYTPAVGDVFSVALYPGRDRQYFLAYKVDEKPKMYGPWVYAEHVDGPTSELDLAMNSEIGRTVLFERKATVAEMAAHGLKEKDVPAKYQPWTLASDATLVARFFDHSGVCKERSALVRRVPLKTSEAWEVELDGNGPGFGPRAFCETKLQALQVAEVMAGQELDWKRWF